MIIKSFSAPGVAGALKMIKEELGNDAIILRTRHCAPEEAALTGYRIEVTACIDEKAVVKNAPVAAPKMAVKRSNVDMKTHDTIIPSPKIELDDKFDFAGKLDKKIDFIIKSHRGGVIPAEITARMKPIYLNLIDSDLPDEIARQIAADIEKAADSDKKIGETAVKIMTDMVASLSASPLDITAGMKVVFAGPSGSGKTSALAKMAAQLATKEKKRVTLASLDNMKISSYEEIGGYADILGLRLDLSGVPELNHKDDSILLIDTPSFHCHDKKSLSLIKRVEKLNPDILFLVISVCSRTVDLVDAVGLFDNLKPTHLIASHLDDTGRWGGIITMNQYLERPLAMISDSPAGSGLLEQPNAGQIARRLLNLDVNQNDK